MAIDIEKKTLHFFVVEGQAFNVITSSETVYARQYSVLANGEYPTSHEKEETSFWVKDTQGREYSITFQEKLPLRGGHDVQVVYGQWDHHDVMYPIAVYNKTMKTLHRRGLQEILTCFSIRFRSDSGCGGAFVTLFAFLLAPIVGGITAGEKGATVAFIFGLCVFLPYILIPPHQEKKRRRAFSEDLEGELRRLLPGS